MLKRSPFFPLSPIQSMLTDFTKREFKKRSKRNIEGWGEGEYLLYGRDVIYLSEVFQIMTAIVD